MKAKGIISTVGFNVSNDATAIDLPTGCDTDASHAYFPVTRGDPKATFDAIAHQCTNPRIKG